MYTVPSYRTHTATIAPLLLGMSGLGGAMIRKSKRRLSDFTDIQHLAEGEFGMQMTKRQIELLRVRQSVCITHINNMYSVCMA
jgi:hypothetical protein